MSDQSYSEDLLERIRKIKALLFDVDGVLTDGRIIIHADGGESKHFDVQDGLGIYYARKCGLIVGVITGRESRVTQLRLEELEADFISQGFKNKAKPYEEFKRKFKLDDDEIGFIGDDIIDLPVMLKCGFAVSVANGREEVRKCAHYVTKASGGKGGVREIIEFILKQQGTWKQIIEKYFGSENGE